MESKLGRKKIKKMSRLKCALGMLLIIVCASLQSQTTNPFLLSQTIQGDILDFNVDNLGNIYLINSTNQLKKIGPKGDSLAVYNDVTSYGKIYSVDVTNPLKILVYYREFSTIIELDRFLNLINTIDLRTQNIFQAKAVALAYDNNIWVYDELEANLKRISDDGSLVSSTGDIRQMVDIAPDPSVISDQSGLVYLYDSTKGLYVFDHYGAFKKRTAIRSWIDFNVIDKIVLGRNNQFFFRYQLPSPDVEQDPIPQAYLPAIKIIITSGAIYVLKKTGLEIYSRT
jgi:hypothetical protein